MNKEDLITQLTELANEYDFQGSDQGEKMRSLIDELNEGIRDTTSIKINATVTLKKFDGEGTDSEPVETITRTTGL